MVADVLNIFGGLESVFLIILYKLETKMRLLVCVSLSDKFLRGI